MTPLFVVLSLALNVWAIAVQREAVPCTFSITALGLKDGIVREDTIGQPRLGGSFPQNSFLVENGALKDSWGHTCIVLADTSQLQCTSGVTSNIPFTLSDSSYVEYDKNSNWLACPASGPGKDGSQNIFSDAKKDKTGCQAIQLLAGTSACAALGKPDTSPLTPVIAAACPSDISSGTFQYPHLIVPTSPQSPDYKFGNSFKAYISATNSTLFNFDIPNTAPYLGTCSLLFQFPYASHLAWPGQPDYYFSGLEQEEGSNGGVQFALLQGIANTNTNFRNTPAIEVNYGKTKVQPGHNYTIATFPCPSGRTITYSAVSIGNVEVDFFEDSRPEAIGLYIVPCA